MTALALTTGLGLGLVPAQASGSGDDPAAPKVVAKVVPAQIPPAADADKADADRRVEVALKLVADQDMDDVTFLRRLSLDLRGELPTDVEEFFFVADEDANKRPKVVAWLVADDDVVRHFAARATGRGGQPRDRGPGHRRGRRPDAQGDRGRCRCEGRQGRAEGAGRRVLAGRQAAGGRGAGREGTGKWVLLGEALKGQSTRRAA